MNAQPPLEPVQMRLCLIDQGLPVTGQDLGPGKALQFQITVFVEQPVLEIWQLLDRHAGANYRRGGRHDLSNSFFFIQVYRVSCPASV